MNNITSEDIKVLGRIVSVSTENVVADAEQIYDSNFSYDDEYTSGASQSAVNNFFSEKIKSIGGIKYHLGDFGQDALTIDHSSMLVPYTQFKNGLQVDAGGSATFLSKSYFRNGADVIDLKATHAELNGVVEMTPTNSVLVNGHEHITGDLVVDGNFTCPSFVIDPGTITIDADTIRKASTIAYGVVRLATSGDSDSTDVITVERLNEFKTGIDAQIGQISGTVSNISDAITGLSSEIIMTSGRIEGVTNIKHGADQLIIRSNINSGAIVNLSSGTLTGVHSITMSGNVNSSPATISNVDILNISTGGNISMHSGIISGVASLGVDSTILFPTGSGHINIPSGDIAGPKTISMSEGTITGVNVLNFSTGSGTLNFSTGSGEIYIPSGSINGPSKIDMNGGEIDMNSGSIEGVTNIRMASDGNIDMFYGSISDVSSLSMFSGSISNVSNIAMAPPGSISNAHNITFVTGAGSINNPSAITMQTGGTLDMSGGTITNIGDIELSTGAIASLKRALGIS